MTVCIYKMHNEKKYICKMSRMFKKKRTVLKQKFKMKQIFLLTDLK